MRSLQRYIFGRVQDLRFDRLSASIVLGFGVFLFDIFTSTVVASGVLYALAVGVYSRSHRRSDLLIAGAVCSGLVLLGWVFSPDGSSQGTELGNRVIALVAIWVTVAISVGRTRVVQLGDLLDSTTDGIVVIDRKGSISLVNSNIQPLLGYSSQELVGKSVSEILPEILDESGAEIHQRMFSYTRGRSAGSVTETTAKRKDGVDFPAEIKLSPVGREGETHTVAVIRDVTDRKRAEAVLAAQAVELERSNAELEQFAYVSSHDLQEPLRMVASYIQLLQRRYEGKLDSDADEFIGYAVDGTVRMQRLVNDLLELSRVGTHGQEFKPTECSKAFDDAVSNLEVAIEESRAEVSHDPLPTLVADESQLMRLMQNLIGNAIKYRGDRDVKVHVGAERNGGDWILSVRDNGIGIDPRYFDQIFGIFKRLHGRGEFSGTGIGLAVCKKIVERHGGQIWVESEPGAYSKFSFSIPSDSNGSPGDS